MTIRVQSDNIPSHCAYAVHQPEEHTMDWSATWLPAVADSLVAANNVMDQGGVDGLLCNLFNNTAAATIPAASNFVQNEGYESPSNAGVSVSGIRIDSPKWLYSNVDYYYQSEG